MIHLLTFGWPWFAGALALGSLIGFLTFSHEKNAGFSGGWIVVAALLALAAGYGVSLADVLDGREALTLDIAVLAGAAYVAGLPLGGHVKSLAGAKAARNRPVMTPVLVSPAAPIIAQEAEEPAVALEPPAAAPPPNEEPAVPVGETLAGAAAVPPPRAKERAKKSGVKPETLTAPRNGAPDDLSRIKGVGPKSLEKLHAMGVYHYDQIAAWNLENAKWVGAAIGAPGRVERDKWIQQARTLASAGMDH